MAFIADGTLTRISFSSIGEAGLRGKRSLGSVANIPRVAHRPRYPRFNDMSWIQAREANRIQTVDEPKKSARDTRDQGFFTCKSKCPQGGSSPPLSPIVCWDNVALIYGTPGG